MFHVKHQLPIVLKQNIYYNVIDAMNIFEPGQNREIAALKIPVHVHHFF